MVEGGGVKGSVDSLDVEPTIMPVLPSRGGGGPGKNKMWTKIN
jgi:hypothetical protein